MDTLNTLSQQMLAMGLVIANRAVVSDIETECVQVDLGDGHRWYDTRPMLDPREKPDVFIDMATEALNYAEGWGLMQRHGERRYLVRITAPASV